MLGNDFLEVSVLHLASTPPSVGMEAKLLDLGVNIHIHTVGRVTSATSAHGLCWIILHRTKLLLNGRVCQ